MIRRCSKYAMCCIGVLAFSLPVSASPWFVEGRLGSSKLNVDQNQTLQDNGTPYFYEGSGHSSDHNEGIYGLGVGYRWEESQWNYELALQYTQAEAQNFGGTIAPIESQFALINADYDISNQRLMLSGKALFRTESHWSPYAMVGIGYARNRFENYSASQVPDSQSTSDPDSFGSHDTDNLAWQAGLGIRYHWTQCLKVDLGYQYSELGDARSAPGQRSGDEVKINNLSANELLLGVNYQF